MPCFQRYDTSDVSVFRKIRLTSLINQHLYFQETFYQHRCLRELCADRYIFFNWTEACPSLQTFSESIFCNCDSVTIQFRLLSSTHYKQRCILYREIPNIVSREFPFFCGKKHIVGSQNEILVRLIDRPVVILNEVVFHLKHLQCLPRFCLSALSIWIHFHTTPLIFTGAVQNVRTCDMCK